MNTKSSLFTYILIIITLFTCNLASASQLLSSGGSWSSAGTISTTAGGSNHTAQCISLGFWTDDTCTSGPAEGVATPQTNFLFEPSMVSINLVAEAVYNIGNSTQGVVIGDIKCVRIQAITTTTDCSGADIWADTPAIADLSFPVDCSSGTACVTDGGHNLSFTLST